MNVKKVFLGQIWFKVQCSTIANAFLTMVTMTQGTVKVVVPIYNLETVTSKKLTDVFNQSAVKFIVE